LLFCPCAPLKASTLVSANTAIPIDILLMVHLGSLLMFNSGPPAEAGLTEKSDLMTILFPGLPRQSAGSGRGPDSFACADAVVGLPIPVSTVLAKRPWARSRSAKTPESCSMVGLPENGERRECRVSSAPPASRAHATMHTSVVTTGPPKHSGIPCAMVLRLIRDLPGVPGSKASITGG